MLKSHLSQIEIEEYLMTKPLTKLSDGINVFVNCYKEFYNMEIKHEVE